MEPYASIILSGECHIAALKRHLEMRGLAVPEDPDTGKAQVPATVKESAEERNVAMYDQLPAQRLYEIVQDQRGGAGHGLGKGRRFWLGGWKGSWARVG